METIKININDQATWVKAYSRMKEVFETGGIALFPTDTVYGLGGNALKEIASQKLLLIKRRDAAKAFPVFVRDVAQGRSIALVNKAQECFLKKAWPGQVTAILKKRPELSNRVTGGQHTVGLRIPNFPFLNTFMKEISFPLVETSANISGEEPFRDGMAAAAFFKEQEFQPDLVVDCGRLPDSKPSTVIDLTTLAVLREGVVAKKVVSLWWEECVIEKMV